jgi:hypothetical protein
MGTRGVAHGGSWALRDLDRQHYLRLQRAIIEAKRVGFYLHRAELNQYEPSP